MKSFFYTDHSVRNHDQLKKGAWWTWSFLLVLLLVSKIFLFASRPEFAKDKYFFSGSTSAQKAGYVAEVNKLLNKFIKGRLDQIDLSNLLDDETMEVVRPGEGFLTFSRAGGSEPGDLRLTGIRGFENKKDSLFFFNSLLPEHLKIQAIYSHQRIFNIRLSQRPDGGVFISEIRIDPNILSVPLISSPNFWKNDVVASTDSLFKDFAFIKLGSSWLPVGELQRQDTTRPVNEYGFAPDRTINFLGPQNAFEIVKGAVLRNERVYRIEFGDNQSIQVAKLKDSLHLFCINVGDLEFLWEGMTEKHVIRDDNRYKISMKDGPFEIKFKGGLRTNIGTVYCTRENPINTLSFVVSHNRKDFRYAVSGAEADLFSAMMARTVPDIENVFWKLKGKGVDSSFRVCYNPVLARYLQDEMQSYIHNNEFLRPYNDSVNRALTIKMGVTIMNTANAEVLAAPWHMQNPGNITEYKYLSNYNFQNHPIGSCFKPLLYFASFRRYPRLSNLVLTTGMVSDYAPFRLGGPENRRNVTMLGYPTQSFFGDSREVGEDLTTALAKSSNLYPAITFLYSATEERPDIMRNLQQGRLPDLLYENGRTSSDACAVLDNNLHMNGLARNMVPKIYKGLYDVEEMNLLVGDKDQYCYNFWDRSYSSSGNRRPDKKLNNYGILCPQQVSLHFDAFNDLNGNVHAGSFRTEVVPWILGSQNNLWNNIKLCEAFTRVVTGVHNRGRLELQTKPDAGVSSLYDTTRNIATLEATRNDFSDAHSRLIDALDGRSHSRLRLGSTWTDVSNLVAGITIPGINSPIVILAKTGTGNDVTYGGKTHHYGSFMFALMTQTQFDSLKTFIGSGYRSGRVPKRLGITGVISLELTDQQEESPLFYSRYARLFLADRQRIIDLIMLNRHLFN